jgi:esterase/lipase superfamily enzyme
MFIKSLTVVDRQQFIEDFSRAGKDQAFVFIHGYNTSFEDAALRTAQIAYDLRYPGVPFFYSWPSQGSLEGYFTDEKNVAKSDLQLYDFLKILVDEGGFEKINIIAHSMGNRVTLNAMMRFRNEEAPVFNHLVMAAPDVDADLFKTEIAPFLQSVSKSNTLYASSNDVALAVSKVVNSKPRAGQAGEDIIVIDPVETIDASAVRADLLGHGYFYNHWRLIQDVYKLVIEDLRAPQRELFENQLQQQKYWSLNDE